MCYCGLHGYLQRLIVEFAIENQRALHRKQLRQERSKVGLPIIYGNHCIFIHNYMILIRYLY